jgi:O-antigen ligase
LTGRSITFWLLLLLVAAFPWDDALGYPSDTVSVVKLLGLALVVAYVATVFGRSAMVWAPTLPAVAVFVALVFVSLGASGDVGSGAAQALRYVQFAGLFFLLTQLVQTRTQVVQLFAVLTASAAIASIVGLVRVFTDVTDRAAGPIADANDFGYVLAAVLPIGLYLVSRGGRARIGWFIAVLLIGCAILGTLSRGTIVSLAVAALWAAVAGRLRLRSVAASAAVLGVIAAALLIFQRPFVDEHLHAKGVIANDNVQSRKALWRGALEMTADHPFLGVGTGQYRFRAAEYVVGDPLNMFEPVAHNAYLEVLAENGVFGLLAFATFIVGTWLLLRRARRNAVAIADRDATHLVDALQASFITAVVGAAFLSVQIAPPLWLVGALAVRWRR